MANTPTVQHQPTPTELVSATPVAFIDELWLKQLRKADERYRKQLRRWFQPVIVVEGETLP